MLTTEINNVGAVNNVTKVAPRGAEMTQDDFIKLLLTQMRLQTPQNPFDSNTMMQQMSQLTTLSATHEMEAAVKSLNTNLGASQVLSASQLIGKQVQVPSELSPLVDGHGLKGSLIIPRDVDKVTVTIKDLNDRVIKTIELGASSTGVLDFDWSGLDEANNPSAPGFYKMSATGLIGSDNIGIPTAGTFNVNSVALGKNGEGVIMNLEGLGGVKMSDVIKIM